MYLRVASAREEDQGAIDRQREGCMRIAERHGLTIVREYADAGRSARLNQQIELLHLLSDLSEKRDVEAIIVWDYARLGRSMEQLEQVIHHIHACGAEIVTITGVEAAERFVQEHGLSGEQSSEEGGSA
jgi:DNA invertase Pin-like site-specific DNA recombinase